MTIGEHTIKSWCRQQKVVALSSAEAELYAMVMASAEALAIVGYAADLGMQLGCEILADSSAALGIAQRAGVGKVRHLRTQGLWVQEVRASGRVNYKKVLGTKNPADLLTKHLAGEVIDKHVEAIGQEFRGGRAEAAPTISSLESYCQSYWDGGADKNIEGSEKKKGKTVRFEKKAKDAGAICSTTSTPTSSASTTSSSRGQVAAKVALTPSTVRRASTTTASGASSTPRVASTRASSMSSRRGKEVASRCSTCGEASGRQSRWADYDEGNGVDCVECAGHFECNSPESFEPPRRVDSERCHYRRKAIGNASMGELSVRSSRISLTKCPVGISAQATHSRGGISACVSL